MLMYFIYFMFFSGVVSFLLNKNHFLLMLISLEFMVITLYYGLFHYFNYLNYEYFMSMIFLTMSVCEGVLGLSVLILMVRVYGNDYILTFSSLW